MKSFEWRKTQDGSPAFYSYEYEELSHNLTSSKQETYEYFIKGTNFLSLASKKPVKILEIGFGAGINYSYFQETGIKNFTYLGLEKNEDFKEFINPNDQLKVLWGDAEKLIQTIEESFDIIIHDAFSTKKEIKLWSVSFLKNLLKLTHSETILSTYCTAPRVLKSFIEAGWFIERAPGLYPKKYSLRAYSQERDNNKIRQELSHILSF